MALLKVRIPLSTYLMLRSSDSGAKVRSGGHASMRTLNAKRFSRSVASQPRSCYPIITVIARNGSMVYISSTILDVTTEKMSFDK